MSLPAWLAPWKAWLLAIPAVLVAVLLGWLVLARSRRPRVTIENAGGLKPEHLAPVERSRVQETERRLLEADQELRSVIERPELNDRSNELADLLNRRR